MSQTKLHRFDGRTWTTHKPYPLDLEDRQDIEDLAEALIEALDITPQGDVWFGTANGAYHLADQALALTGAFVGWRYVDDGSFHLLDQTPVHYTTANGLPSDHVQAITAAHDGTVWFGTDRGAARFDGQTWQPVTVADGLPHNEVADIAVAPDGALWFLTAGGITRYVTEELAVAQVPPSLACTPIPPCTPTPTPRPTRTPVPPPPTPTLTPLPDMFRPVIAVGEILSGAFQRLHVAPDGELWMVTERAVAQRVDDTWQVRLNEADFGADAGGRIVGIDAAERVWVASQDTSEITAWDGVEWTRYSAGAGWTLVGDEEAWQRNIGWGRTDRQGRFWLATSADVRVFDGGAWTVYAPEDMDMGPPEDGELFHDFHVAPMTHGDQVWVGACEWAGPGPVGGRGVRYFDGQTWQGADSPVASGCALDIEEDEQGRVWTGVGGTLWRYDPASGDWASFTPPEDLPGEGWRRYGAATGISLDAAGEPWVTLLLCGGASCDTEALYHVQDGVWTQVGELGVYAGPVIEIDTIDTIDTIDGAPWLFGGGIHRVEGQTLEMVAPLLVQSVDVDGAGRVWFVARYQSADWLWTVDQEREKK